MYLRVHFFRFSFFELLVPFNHNHGVNPTNLIIIRVDDTSIIVAIPGVNDRQIQEYIQ